MLRHYDNQDVLVCLTSSGPAGLAVPDLGKLVVTTGDFLNVGYGLGHVVEVHPGGVVGLGTLPESEGIDQAANHQHHLEGNAWRSGRRT